MTKADIVESVSEKCRVSRKESCDMVVSVFSIIKSTLETGEDTKIPGFGKFEVKKKQERLGRNPQTGEAIKIDARRILSFNQVLSLKLQYKASCSKILLSYRDRFPCHQPSGQNASEPFSKRKRPACNSLIEISFPISSCRHSSVLLEFPYYSKNYYDWSCCETSPNS